MLSIPKSIFIGAIDALLLLYRYAAHADP